MNRLRQFVNALIAAAFIGALAFAASAYLAMASAQESFESRSSRLAEAKHVFKSSAAVLSSQAKAASAAELKPLVQQASGRSGVNLAFLTEVEKDVDEGVREHAVIFRANGVAQPKLVAFLRDLEAKGGGARIKELRLKASAEHTGEYQEVEATLALRTLTQKSPAQTTEDQAR
jgi:hypothetical protein